MLLSLVADAAQSSFVKSSCWSAWSYVVAFLALIFSSLCLHVLELCPAIFSHDLHILTPSGLPSLSNSGSGLFFFLGPTSFAAAFLFADLLSFLLPFVFDTGGGRNFSYTL